MYWEELTMGKNKRKESKGLQSLNNLRIQERLKKSNNMILGFATFAAIVGVIAILVVAQNYKKAMENYGLI